MGMSDELVEDERLAPGFDSVRLAKIIDDYPNAESIMVVGHEPDMSAAVSKLIGGGRLQLKKGGLATVEVVERVGDFVFGVLVSLMTPAHSAGGVTWRSRPSSHYRTSPFSASRGSARARGVLR